MTLDLAQRLNDDEITARDRLEAAVSLPIGVLTIIGGAIVYYAHEYPFGTSLLDILFTWFLGVALYCFLRSVVHLVRSFHGYEYETLASSDKLRDHLRDLERWYTGKGEDKALAQADFNAAMAEHLIDAATTNRANNSIRGTYLYYCQRSMLWAFGFTLLGGIPFLVAVRISDEAPQPTIVHVHARYQPCPPSPHLAPADSLHSPLTKPQPRQ